MEFKTFVIICIFFSNRVAIAEKEQGVINAKIIQKNIKECGKNFLGYIDKHLPDDIHKILEKVSNTEFKNLGESMENKINLESLKMEHLTGFNAILTAVMDFNEGVIDATEIVMKAAALKRGDLEMSTIIFPFEYPGHKCGFERNVKVPT